MKREEKEGPLFLLEVWADLLGALRGPREKDESGAYSETPRALTSTFLTRCTRPLSAVPC